MGADTETKSSGKQKGRGQHSQLAAFEFPTEGRGRSHDLVRVLSFLWRKGKSREGDVSNAQGKKIWMPEWKAGVSTLLDWGLVKEEPSGHGNTHYLFLSEDGQEWAEDYFGFASPHEEARAGIPEAGNSELANVGGALPVHRPKSDAGR